MYQSSFQVKVLNCFIQETKISGDHSVILLFLQEAFALLFCLRLHVTFTVFFYEQFLFFEIVTTLFHLGTLHSIYERSKLFYRLNRNSNSELRIRKFNIASLHYRSY